MAQLRGHHLICLNFFKGEGYSQDFVENIFRILEDDQIEVIFGADDVCSKCPYLREGVCIYKENAEENIVELDQMAYKLLDIYPGMRTDWKIIGEKIPLIMENWKKFACVTCDWKRVCEENEEWKNY